MFYPIKLPKSTAEAALFSGKMFAQCNCKRGGTGMAAVLSLAFVLFGGMIFFAVCGMLIERWCEEEQTASRPDASHHQSLKRKKKKKAC